jgi:adenosylhomocysteine nucleosidase
MVEVSRPSGASETVPAEVEETVIAAQHEAILTRAPPPRGARERAEAVALSASARRASAGRGLRLGVIMGLQAEAQCLRGCAPDAAPLTWISGGSGLRARAGAEQLRAEGAEALVSFGLAVGLAPVLRPGDVVLADAVVMPDGRALATDAAWRAALLRRLASSDLNLRVARIAGSDETLTSAGAKRRAFQTTFAAALDTESHAVAEVAAAAGLPLLVLRAVAEPAEEMRPAVAFAATSADGRARSLALVGHLAAHPWQIPAAWRFSKNGRQALEALRRVVAAAPRLFAYVSD